MFVQKFSYCPANTARRKIVVKRRTKRHFMDTLENAEFIFYFTTFCRRSILFLFCLASTNFTLVDKKVKNDVSTLCYNFLVVQKVKTNISMSKNLEIFYGSKIQNQTMQKTNPHRFFAPVVQTNAQNDAVTSRVSVLEMTF